MEKGKADKPIAQKILFPAIMLIIFWILAIVLWQSTQHIFYLFNFGYIGTSLGFGIGLYSLLPRKRKPFGRKIAQFLVGGYMLGFLGLFAFENMQIEGFWLLLFYLDVRNWFRWYTNTQSFKAKVYFALYFLGNI